MRGTLVETQIFGRDLFRDAPTAGCDGVFPRDGFFAESENFR
jgi:hypothetical protein